MTALLAAALLSNLCLPAQEELLPRPRRRARDPLPNVELVRHDGERVRFQDDLVEGHVVVLNFMYTTCADVCPMETARLCEVQEILGSRVGESIRMASITVDPTRDTPEVLADYRERFGVEPGWDFFTGVEEDILQLRRELGLYFDDTEDLQDHNINMVIGNPRTGQWIKRSPFDNPYVLATQISAWVDDFRGEGVGTAAFEEAPVRLRELPEGESLFRTRCAVCHRVGEGDGQPRLGPNLQGVMDRRDPKWLMRWILEPDVMLAEADPLATGLFLAHDRIPMPNLGLSPEEARAILGFLEVEGRRTERVESREEVARLRRQEVPECCQKEDVALIAPRAEGEGAPSTAPRGSSRGWGGLRLALGCVLGALGLALRFRSPAGSGEGRST